ncbi:MAG: NADH-quinone oxidoreductase subunit A [Chloroflexi bacterium]|nr:NADH-quinone oxidoreductase subunit A [Chloroflexota bacterium]
MPDGYALNWFAILLVAVVGVGAIGTMFLSNRLIAPRRPSEVKNSPYECGIEPAPFRWSQVNIRYYVFAILFIIFDVEAVFLFPWALVFLKTVPAVFYEMLIFMGILFFGIIYGWRKGVLQWK